MYGWYVVAPLAWDYIPRHGHTGRSCQLIRARAQHLCTCHFAACLPAITAVWQLTLSDGAAFTRALVRAVLSRLEDMAAVKRFLYVTFLSTSSSTHNLKATG